MRILGADSFVGKDTSINAIPVNYLVQGDVCLVKIGNDDVEYTPSVYFYEFITNDGNDQSIPDVITPLDQFDLNVNGDSGDDGSRWRLKGVYVDKLHANSVITGTITSPTSGGQIFVGEDLTVGPNGIIVDGQVRINSSIYDPPLVLTSSVMVRGLNAQYLGGRSYDDFLKNDNNQIYIPEGVSELDVYITNSMTNPPHYSVMIDMCNLDDDDPAIYSWMITNKEPDHFTIKFSGIIDSPNYILHYFMIGVSDSTIDPPPPSGCCPSGSPSGSPPPSAVYP